MRSLNKRAIRVYRNMYDTIIVYRGVAQFGGAPGLGPGGRKFKSCHLESLEKGKLSPNHSGRLPATVSVV